MIYNRFAITVFLIFFLLVPVHQVFGVGGLSNTKVVVPSTETVPYKRYEFEPFFGFELVDDEVDTWAFEAGSRFTYGFTGHLEAGLNLSYLTAEDSDISKTDYDLGNISPGLKYRFFEFSGSNEFSIAYQGGLTIPTRRDSEKWLFEPVGFISTLNFSPRFSVDSDVVLTFEEDDSWGFVGNTGVGYFVTEIFQPVVELGYEFNDPDEGPNIGIVNVTGGFTAAPTDYLTIIVGVTRDIVSENSDDSLVFSAAFTFLF